MILDIEVTEVYEDNFDALESDVRFIRNQGGSRSSKTWSLCQLVIVMSLSKPGILTSIIRKSFPALRATVMRDFFEVLNGMELYDKSCHNKTEHIYTFPNGSQVEFFSADDEQKLRGRKRDYAWCNEANELTYEEFNQLNMRTSGKLFFDYNPSESASWLYDLPPNQTVTIKSSFLKNPFLEKEIVEQIKQLQYTDEELWAIYGLGEKTTSRLSVYNHFVMHKGQRPKRFTNFVYGIDFGYNHPTALLKIWYFEDELYIEELIYESFLTADMIVERMGEIGVDKRTDIMADHARPEVIEVIRKAGYLIKEADKAVKKGIDDVKSRKVFVDENALNVWKEFENYKFKKVAGKITDEVVKLWDDAMDALRYGTRQIAKVYSRSQGKRTVIRTYK